MVTQLALVTVIPCMKNVKKKKVKNVTQVSNTTLTMICAWKIRIIMMIKIIRATAKILTILKLEEIWVSTLISCGIKILG